MDLNFSSKNEPSGKGSPYWMKSFLKYKGDEMGDKGKKDKGKREEQKKSKHSKKDKKKQRKDKKEAPE